MRRRLFSLMLIAGMGAAGAGCTALAKEPAAAPSLDLNGEWLLNRSLSDGPGERGEGRPGPGMDRGDRMSRGGRQESRMGRRGPGGRGGEPGSQRMRLPGRMHITQATTLVSFEDSSGAVIREITTVTADADSFMHAPGAERLSGQWKEGRLEVQRPGWRGATVTETYALEDGGRMLVIRTKMEASGSAPARELKRVYVRASG